MPCKNKSIMVVTPMGGQRYTPDRKEVCGTPIDEDVVISGNSNWEKMRMVGTYTCIECWKLLQTKVKNVN